MQNVWGIVVSYVFVAVIMLLGKPLEKFGKEISRKFIHIMLSFWWFIAMYFFQNVIWASVVPISFIIINYISYKKDFIKVMERDKQDGLGTVYYAISLWVLVIITFGIMKRPSLGLIPVFIMGFGDGFASLIGQKIKSYQYKVGQTKKSVAGSLAMFVISSMILMVSLAYLHIDLWFIKSILLAMIATLLEAIFTKGTDNLSVPIGIAILICIIV